MPFDQSDEVSSNQAAISALVRHADHALETSERGKCIDIIQQIYDLLDSSSNACVIRPSRPHVRANPRRRAAIKPLVAVSRS